MARTGKPRNSAPSRKPVTIDLEAEDISAASPATSAPASGTSEAAEPRPEPVAMDDANTGTEEPEQKGDRVSNTDKPKAASPASARSGRGGGLGAGFAGGLLALIGGAALQWGGLLPSPGTGEPAVQVDLAPLQAEIETLKESVNNAPAASGASSDAMAAIVDRVSALEAQTSKAIDGLSATLNGVGKRIDDADRKLIEIGAGGGTPGTDGAALGTLQASLEETRATVQTLSEQVTAVQQETNKAIDGLSATMNGLGQRVDAAEKQVSELAQRGGDASVARAIAAAGLKSAIDRGGPFMAELEAYATVAGDSETVSGLRANAAAGVPTQAQLAEEFPAVANRIVATGAGLDENASMTDRLMASARSLVQIRPVGEIEGETPGAITARMESRIKAGDIAAALEEWNKLPDAGKDVSKDFAEKMQARLTVDGLVAKTLTDAMAATTANQ